MLISFKPFQNWVYGVCFITLNSIVQTHCKSLMSVWVCCLFVLKRILIPCRNFSITRSQKDGGNRQFWPLFLRLLGKICQVKNDCCLNHCIYYLGPPIKCTGETWTTWKNHLAWPVSAAHQKHLKFAKTLCKKRTPFQAGFTALIKMS